MQGSSGGIFAATIGRGRRAFGWVGLFSLCINLLMLTVSLYTWQIFDHVIASQSRETLIYLTIIAIGAVLVLGLLELVRSRILVGVSVWLEQRLAPEAFERGIAAALYARPYRTQALRDLGQLRSFLGGSAIFSLFDAPVGPDLSGRGFPPASAGWPGRAGGRRSPVLVRRRQRAADPHAAAVREPGRDRRHAAGRGQCPQCRGDRRHGYDARRCGELDGRQRPRPGSAGGGQSARRQRARPDKIPTPGGADRGAWNRRSAGGPARADRRRHDRRLDPDLTSAGAGRAGDRDLEAGDQRARRLRPPAGPLRRRQAAARPGHAAAGAARSRSGSRR